MKNTLSLTLLFLLALIFCWPILSGTEHLYFRDTLLHTLPEKWFFKNYFHGLPAFWNPHIYLGFPQFAVPANATFYPLNLIFILGPVQQSYPYFILAHFLLALGFTYGFVKEITQQEAAGLLAATAFGFSGFLVFSAASHAGFFSAVWLPAILFFLKKSEGSQGFAVAAGLCGACQILAGEVHYAAMTCLVCLGFCLMEFPKLKAWKTIAMFLGIAVGLSAVQIVPTLEFLPHSSRQSGLSWQEATTWSLHPMRLLEFITPFPFGTIYPSFRLYRGGQYFPLRFNQPFILSVYFGMVPILFLLLSIRDWRQKHHRLWVGAGLLFLLLSFGQWSPFFKIVHHLPFFSSFRYPEKFVWIATFCFIIISAKTFSKIPKTKFVIIWLVLLLSVIDLYVFAKQVFLTTPINIPALQTPWMKVVNAQRLLRFTDFQPRFPLSDIPEIEKDHVISFLSGKENTHLMLHQNYTFGYDGLTLGQGSESQLAEVSKLFLNETGTHWVLAGFGEPVPAGLHVAYESQNLNIRLWENLESAPLVYLSKPGAAPRSVDFQRPTPDEIRIHLQRGDTGELVVNETNYPGWRAWADGRAVMLNQTKAFGKSITLTGDEQDVIFRFQPWSFRLGFGVSMLTLFSTILFLVFLRRSKPPAETSS